MHAGATRRADGQQRQPILDRAFDSPRHLLADDRAHAGAHEAEVSHSDAQRYLFEQASPADDRLGHAGLALALDQLLLIGLAGAHEAERIARAETAILL